MEKDYSRGIDDNFIDLMMENQMIMKCLKERDEKKLFLGIRNGYCNIYYKGVSVVKIEQRGKKLLGKTAQEYASHLSKDIMKDQNSNKNGYITIPLDVGIFDLIIKGIDGCLEDGSGKSKKLEKQCQQNIIVENNNLAGDSKWFCVDMEYTMQRETSEITNYGRFDIIAVSKERAEDSGKYKVALIELKVGNSSFKGISQDFQKKVQDKKITLPLNVSYKEKIGSGILGHFSDYVRYLADPIRFDKLKKEILTIINNYKQLKILPDDILQLTDEDFEMHPEVVFLTYSGDKNIESIKGSFKRYLLNCVPGCSQYNVQDIWEETITRKYIPQFKYVFRQGNGDSQNCQPVFYNLEISENDLEISEIGN